MLFSIQSFCIKLLILLPLYQIQTSSKFIHTCSVQAKVKERKERRVQYEVGLIGVLKKSNHQSLSIQMFDASRICLHTNNNIHFYNSHIITSTFCNLYFLLSLSCSCSFLRLSLFSLLLFFPLFKSIDLFLTI